MLKVNALSIERGNYTLNADFEIERGKICGVIGPSGAGKTTLALAIAGLLPLRSGTIHWDDERIDNVGPASRYVSLMFQEHNLFTQLNIVENLRLATRDDNAIHELLDTLDLGDHKHKRPQMLSGGQKARAAFARNILHGNPIQIFDEPFAAIGPAQRRRLQQLISEMIRNNDRIALVVAHNINDLYGWADALLWVGETVTGPHQTQSFLENPPVEAQQYL